MKFMEWVFSDVPLSQWNPGHELSLKFYMKLGSAHIARFVWRKREMERPIYWSGSIARCKSDGFQKIARILNDYDDEIDEWLTKASASFIRYALFVFFIISGKMRLDFLGNPFFIIYCHFFWWMLWFPLLKLICCDIFIYRVACTSIGKSKG